jgi:hypothetical protein
MAYRRIALPYSGIFRANMLYSTRSTTFARTPSCTLLKLKLTNKSPVSKAMTAARTLQDILATMDKAERAEHIRKKEQWKQQKYGTAATKSIIHRPQQLTGKTYSLRKRHQHMVQYRTNRSC